MATKTLTIKESTYERLLARKQDNESFSDVIDKLTGKNDIMKFAGILSKESADELMKNIKERRKSELEMKEERVKKIEKMMEGL